MKLYKYTAIKYAIAAIDHGIYAGSLDSFNDPYEYLDIQDTSHFRVCCTTTCSSGFPDDINLWAYYGKHRGCCIEFEVPDDDQSGLVRPVNYTDVYTRNAGDDYDTIFHNLYNKDREHWKQENETRIVYYDKDINNKSYWNFVGEGVYFKARVTCVVFGLEVDINKKDAQQLMTKIRNYNRKRDVLDQITLKKCMILTNSFGFCEDKQFTSDWDKKILEEYRAKGLKSLRAREIFKVINGYLLIICVLAIILYFSMRPTETPNLLDIENNRYREGQELLMGVYEQDGDNSNGCEPIEWIVLSIDENELLLISKHEIEWCDYNTENSDGTISWVQSTLRLWLNGEFYNNAFSESEKKHIMLSPNMTCALNKQDKTSTSVYSEDYVFILDEIQYSIYSTNIDNMYFSPTINAKQNAIQSANWDEKDIRWQDWLIRSTGQHYLFYNCYSKNIETNSLDYGGFIRPIIRVKV